MANDRDFPFGAAGPRSPKLEARAASVFRRSFVVLGALWLTSAVFGHATVVASERPKVRAITAFVRIDRGRYQSQVGDALRMLRQAKAAFEQAGYEVQSLRVTTQPFPEYTRGLSRDAALGFFREYDGLARKEGFDATVGPAMLGDQDDPAGAELLGELLAATTQLEGSLVVADPEGLHPNALRAAARLVRLLTERTPRSQGSFRFAATACLAPHAPFYPGSYHLGPGREFAVGLQSANVVAEVFRKARGPEAARRALVAALTEHALAVESVARSVERTTGWKYAGLDLSPAPLKEVSIGEAIENFTGAKIGSSGTLTAAAVITEALRAVPVERVGYSGLMLPVLEDSVLARRWSEGALTLDSLLAYSAVCGTGLDVIPLPGDIPVEQIERILTDVASLAVKLHKPLSARLLPVAGKKAGDITEFDDPFLVNAMIQPLP